MKAECNDLQIILSYAVAASSSSWFIFLFLFPSSSFFSLFHLLSHLVFLGVSVRECAGLIISVASWVPAGYLAATPAFHQHISHPEYSWSNSVIHASPDSTASRSAPSLFEYLLLTVLWCSCLLPVTSTLKQASLENLPLGNTHLPTHSPLLGVTSAQFPSVRNTPLAFTLNLWTVFDVCVCIIESTCSGSVMNQTILSKPLCSPLWPS